MEVLPTVSATKLFGLVVFGSIVVFQIGYILLQWLYVRRAEYIYYAVYMAGTFIYGLEEFEHHMPFRIFTRLDPNFHWQVLHALPIFLILIYYHFATTFLDLKNTEPALNRWVSRFKILLVSYCVFELISNFSGLSPAIAEYIFRTVSVVIAFCSILFISTVWRKQNPLIRFALAGAALLLAGSFGSMILLVMEMNGKQLPTDPYLPMLIGVIGELLTFTTGLTYKSRLVEKEKILVEQQLIKEREIKELEKEKAVLESQRNERERIAHDLHDDLGSGITSIRLLSEIAKRKMKTEMPQSEIERISENASELIDNMSEIIWTMNTYNDSLENTVAYIRSYSGNFLQNAGVTRSIHVAGIIPALELKSEVRRNIFLTVKEALHNVVKHAAATEVAMDISINHALEISIRDNGKGFADVASSPFGNGLKNMRARMLDIHGTFDISASPGSGTTIKITYSLS
jgi:signal transduction histidine kinase